LIFALASPISFSSILPNDKSGRDIILCIDSSGSMVENGFNKDDRLISKYDTVVSIVDKFLDTRYSDNIGISIFGTFGFLASPITYDLATLKIMLHNTSANIAGQNTAIGEGLKVAIDAFEYSQAKNKVIILLTDGYHNSGSISPKDAVALAKLKNIKIYAIGIGDNDGYDNNLLQTISSQTNGQVFSAQDSKALGKVFSKLDELEPSNIKSPIYLDKNMLFIYPLIIALLLFIAYFFRSRYV
jgi:Ca-activated chloride channel family protein